LEVISLLSTLDYTAQETLLKIANIASRRQIALGKCRAIEKSDIMRTMNGVERMKAYRRELEQIELELEEAVRLWNTCTIPLPLVAHPIINQNSK
jgi:hypothetical protein